MSTTVAIAYDFDGTLAPGNMQEHVFLPKLGIDPQSFWERSNRLAEEQQGDRTLTYMYRMLRVAQGAELSMRKQDWIEHGRGIALFPGVESWFTRINAAGVGRGLALKHYVISSGLREMIEGSTIRPYLDAVFASGFLYDGSGVAVGAAVAVNYTTKTQFLFRINKGAMDLADDRAVNAFQPPEQRVVPFPNMVFIGDGDTDIPCFRLVREQGGHSIAVFPPDDPQRAANGQRLIAEKRVHCAVLADYSAGGELERRVLAVLDLIAARDVITGPGAGQGA
ncbi:HAD family hydrolase [Plastoroseomonas hellenica]|uniref:HAD family hydrolase n=1 Tax=Plastoroseomonas hellenica TaxID=2687306 RepID=UPI001BA715E4|nr:HAD family hydrolase [Plastoroseomonas hellenica]MBR0647565.1 haloacid dehalogenase-like hydrolase [Plastoroseomonas hellenica]